MSLLIPIKRDYSNEYALQNLILYGLGLDKNQQRKILLEGDFVGFGVNPLTPGTIMESFRLTKRRYCQWEGQQVYHLVISVYTKYDFGVEHKLKIASNLIYDVGGFIEELGFQNVGFIHNYFGNVHIHYVLNSVNFMTGNKLHNENSFYYNILNFLRDNWGILKFDITFNVEDLYG